jgi:putative phosphoesterase
VTIAVFSDVHGNVRALEAVLADIHRQTFDAVYCLGDLVGYGPFPNEVIARMRDAAIPVIMGNYDDGVGFDRDECGCAYREADERMRGQQSLEWTKAHVTPENKAFLRRLVPQIRTTVGGKRLLLVHGSPRKMNEYLFEDRPAESFARLAASADADLIVFGHTHKPYARLVENVWFVNVGSVGKPKDGNWHAGYAILDVGAQPPASFVRVPYDIESVTRAIRESDLPDEFAADLERGGVPSM